MWCYWREGSYFRRDHASAFRIHDENDKPVSSYWLAAPPWFGDPAEDAAMLRRRFKTPEAAMAFADRTWTEGVQQPQK